MSVYEYQSPIYRLICNHVGCLSEFEAESKFYRRTERGTRGEAEKAGWDVPPWRGKGSRRETDLCPQHRGGAS